MKMKRYFYWIAVVTIVGFISSLGLLLQSKADDPDPKPDNKVFLPFVTTDGNATNAVSITSKTIQIAQGTLGGGRIDAFTFFIPFEADLLDNQFDVSTTENLDGVDIEIIISIAVNRDNTIIYYDQWEDGMEPDLTMPTQFSTQVWGDNNLSNGIPPGFGSDVLQAGDIITLRNVVVIPRDSNQLFFDGGDMLSSVGGAVSTAITFWTSPRPPNPGVLFADAWELYPTNRWGNDYRIPIGEDLAGTGPNQRAGFTVVGLTVQAVENGTTVEIDLDGDGNPDAGPAGPLDQGEQFSMIQGVQSGTRVHASAPVQVHIIAIDPAQRFEARGFTLVPEDQWADDYLAPRSSDGDFWLYNPEGSDRVIEVDTNAGPTTITILANTTTKFPPAALSGVTGTRFRSQDGRPFYVLAALDANSAQDWGYALLPTDNLTTQVLIGLGIGNNNNPPGPGNGGNGFESQIYVTATDATTIYVDYDNDGTPDANFDVDPLEEVAITDPNDFDMTGAYLYTEDGTSFAAVWGQDQNATPGIPAIDAGTGITPLRSLALQKTFTLLIDNDCTGSISVGDDVRFRLDYINDSTTLLNTVTVSDTLPAALTYITHTTVQNGLPVADNSGPSPYPLDEGGLNTGNLNGFGAGVLTYDATVNNASTVIINRANANTPSLPLQGDAVTIFIPTGTITPLMQISETLIDPVSGPISAGQVVTFGLTITNTGTTTITTLPLEERFNASHLTFLNAAPAPSITATGVITWSDLTNTFGDFLPNTSISLTISFVVNQLPPAINNTTLAATVRNALRQNSPVPLICTGEANLAFAAPTPTPTRTSTPVSPTPTSPSRTPTPTSSGGGGNSTPRPPTLTPTPIPVAVVPAATATVLPVTFLPETGLWETQPSSLWLAGWLLLLILPGAGALVFLLRRKS